MHIEILVEDSSGGMLLEALVPKILGDHANPHTWRIHPYKGIGRIPPGMASKSDPAKRILLDQLPRILKGYGNSPGIDAVVVVLDADGRNCVSFLNALKRLVRSCNPRPNTMFRLAIEEIEAWYFGDRKAVFSAFPRANKQQMNKYAQDSVCGTWETFADAVHPGGSAAIIRSGWPLPGQIKYDWAKKLGPLLNPDNNQSPSFRKFRDGLRELAEQFG